MRVLTINIWAHSGPYDQREPLLRDELAALQPDLIALQEVDVASRDGNQAAELLDGAGYEVVYERREGPHRADPGIAVASRLPMRDRQTRELGHGGVALAAKVAVGDEEFWFCNGVPLSWLPDREDQREEECLALDDWLGEIAHGDPIPPILAGDFDATPDAASIRFLSGLQSLVGRSTYWVDTFALAGDGSKGYTWSSRNPYVSPFSLAVFAQPEHHRRIDYVFLGSPFRWSPRWVVRSSRVALVGTPEAAPSDHWGVVTDLSLLPPSDGLAGWSAIHDQLWPNNGAG